ncbi:MAG: kynureninase [Clostridiaceae bacterium]
MVRQFEDGLAFARAMDEQDPLRRFKERFYIPQDGIYMDGNSCGLCSRDAEETLLRALDDWKTYGIDVWSHPEANYFLYQDRLASLMAPLIGAKGSEVTICTNTTINIHKALATFYHPTPERFRILLDDLNFPTDKYAVDSQVKLHGLDPADAVKVVPSRDGKTLHEEDLIEAMTEDVCLILLPAVLYRSSYLVDMKKIADAARDRGIICGFDLSHSIGSVPHDFAAIDCDFAVWCNYKYLNGGPGAIAGLYINEKHFDRGPGLAGWQGNRKDTQFDLNMNFEPAHYAGAWQTGTQPILSMAPIEGSLRMFAEAGIENVRAKSLNLTAYLMYLIDEKLKTWGFSYGNPTQDDRRGGHVALEHEDAIRINKALKDRGVIPDFRYPNVIRLAPVAFYVSYEDVYRLVEILIDIMESRAYEQYDGHRGTVA